MTKECAITDARSTTIPEDIGADVIADEADDPEPESGPETGPETGQQSELDALIALSIRDGRWRAACADIAALCREAGGLALAAGLAARGAATGAARGRKRVGEVCILLADDATVRDLNQRYRGHDAATNILSFPCDPGPHPGPDAPFGDLILGYETVAAECRETAAGPGTSLRDHVRHLVVHGCLHLFGFDHETEAEARRMERLEIDLLARLGIANPYPDRWPDHAPGAAL